MSESFPELAQAVPGHAQPERIDIVRAKRHLLDQLGDGQPHPTNTLMASVAALLGAEPLAHPRAELPSRDSVKTLKADLDAPRKQRQPTLAAVQTLSFSTGNAARGAFLALVYGLGLGIPFLVVAVLFERTLSATEFFKRHARLVTRIGGLLPIALGLFEATGPWTAVVTWMHTHWFEAYTPALNRT